MLSEVGFSPFSLPSPVNLLIFSFPCNPGAACGWAPGAWLSPPTPRMDSPPRSRAKRGLFKHKSCWERPWG